METASFECERGGTILDNALSDGPYINVADTGCHLSRPFPCMHL